MITTKTKANAAWNGLSAEQRDTLERWLFEERLGYEKALERARSELGFEGSRTSLQRFYHRTAELRLLRDAASEAESENEEESLRAGMRAVGKIFLRAVTENTDGVKEWAALARLLLHSEGNGLQRKLDGDKSDTWRGWLALAREKFEFDAAEAALEQMENSADLDAEELAREKARVLAIRKRLYGRELTQAEIDKARTHA
jgi:hypothetical protein